MIDVNVFVVKRIFHLRFKVAGLTRKSNIMNKIITKILFENDGSYFIPNSNAVDEVISVNEEVINVNQKIDDVNKIVMPTDFIKSIIRDAENIVIMKKCLCRYSSDCEDYPLDLGCIFIGKTTKKISRHFCREVTVDEAIEHLDKCNEAGLIHIMGRNKMDTVWMNVRPGEELLTICNCCPCCCLWKVYPDLSDSIQHDFIKLPGIDVNCDNSKCVLCKQCIEYCTANALDIVDDKIVIDKNICIGCGHCSNKCPTNAMNITYDNQDIQTAFDRINNLVDYKS